MCVKMMTGPRGSIFCLLTLYVHALTAETDPVLRVKTMNNILSCPGWIFSGKTNGILIVVQWMGNAETQIMNIGDIVALDSNELIVTQYNVDNKIRQAHQFLSCRYVQAIRKCYEYGLDAANRCATIVDEQQSSECVHIFWQMVDEIDELMSRLQGMFSCLSQLSPSKRLDEHVANIVNNFKLYYDNMALDSSSLDKANRDVIIECTASLMAYALQCLGEFWDRFCRLVPLELIIEDISTAAEIVQPSDESNLPNPPNSPDSPSPPNSPNPPNSPDPPNSPNSPNDAVKKIQEHLNTFIQELVTDYENNSLGFEYDPRQRTTSVVNDPQVVYES